MSAEARISQVLADANTATLDRLCNLARAAETWTNEGVRKVFVDGADEASPENVREQALAGLGRVAVAAKNQVLMWTNEGVRKVFVDGVDEASPENVREQALTGLANLSVVDCQETTTSI
eukprot:Stramenopile-MAST_4_protein_1987